MRCKNGESLVVANSGNKSYSTSVLFENNIMQGNSLNFTLYEIKGNTTGEYITKNQTGFYEVSNGYAVQVSIGPYSVIGISLRYSNATVSTSSTSPTTSASSSTTSTSYSTTSTSSYTTANTSGSTSSFSHSSSTTSYTTSKSFSTSFTYSFTTSFSSSSSSVSSYTTSTKTQGIQVPQLDYLLAAVLVLFVLFVIVLIARRKK